MDDDFRNPVLILIFTEYEKLLYQILYIIEWLETTVNIGIKLNIS